MRTTFPNVMGESSQVLIQKIDNSGYNNNNRSNRNAFPKRQVLCRQCALGHQKSVKLEVVAAIDSDAAGGKESSVDCWECKMFKGIRDRR
jgi:hypothetical protein